MTVKKCPHCKKVFFIIDNTTICPFCGKDTILPDVPDFLMDLFNSENKNEKM